MMYKNKYRCGTRLWRKLSLFSRSVYNEVYGNAIRNPERYLRYTASLVPKSEWEVLCHNFACEAAWAAGKAEEKIAA